MDTNVLSKCPICYDIIREPVIFPCQHEICLTCFRKSLETANHWCPICRKRISSWARRNASNPVNIERKRKIEEVLAEADISLLDSSTGDDDVFCWELSKPGELKEDYLAELQKVQEERLMEESMSEEEAKKLEVQEQELVADLKEKERLGEAAARSLEEEEHRKRVDSSHQEDYDGQMAEILSQKYILREFEARKKQLEQDQKLASKLQNVSHVEHPPAKKLKKEVQHHTPITYWFCSSSTQ